VQNHKKRNIDAAKINTKQNKDKYRSLSTLKKE